MLKSSSRRPRLPGDERFVIHAGRLHRVHVHDVRRGIAEHMATPDATARLSVGDLHAITSVMPSRYSDPWAVRFWTS